MKLLLDSGVRATACSVVWNRMIKVPHQALKEGWGHLLNVHWKAIVIKIRKLVEFMCVPLLVLYCCDVPASENRSAVHHGAAMK